MFFCEGDSLHLHENMCLLWSVSIFFLKIYHKENAKSTHVLINLNLSVHDGINNAKPCPMGKPVKGYIP